MFLYKILLQDIVPKILKIFVKNKLIKSLVPICYWIKYQSRVHWYVSQLFDHVLMKDEVDVAFAREW